MLCGVASLWPSLLCVLEFAPLWTVQNCFCQNCIPLTITYVMWSCFPFTTTAVCFVELHPFGVTVPIHFPYKTLLRQLWSVAYACTWTQYFNNILGGIMETSHITNQPTICEVAISYENLQNLAHAKLCMCKKKKCKNILVCTAIIFI